MERKDLPTGISGFRELRKGNYYYVDKTYHIEKLVNSPTTGKSKEGHYFLSRPRRFGKSLLVDTLEHLFAGEKQLFEGLHIYDKWDWTKTYPIIRLNFGSGEYLSRDDIELKVHQQLTRVEKKHELVTFKPRKGLNPTSIGPFHFANVIECLQEKHKKNIVVLVDEYDLPILDVLESPEQAENNCSYLRGFYGALKEHQNKIHFTFVTGISMFSKVNLFSRTNHLNDISVSGTYSTICGYTSHDLETVFAPEIKPYSMDKIRRWYDGYSWDPKNKSPRIFSPNSVLQLFSHDDFQNWWCDESTPKHMYDILKKENITSLDLANVYVEKSQLKAFSAENPDFNILLFQLGYLTICKDGGEYINKYLRLTFPNYEVAESLSQKYLEHRMGTPIPPKLAAKHGPETLRLLISLEALRLQEQLHLFLSKLPCNKNTESTLPEYEWYYGDLMFTLLVSHCSSIAMEETTSHGRSNMVLREKNQVFIFEFKCIDNHDKNPDKISREALQQIKDRKYGDKYRQGGVNVYAVSMVFGRKERNVLKVEIVEA